MLHEQRELSSARGQYYREMASWSLLAVALGALEGGVIGVMLKNLFAGEVGGRVLNYSVALLTGAPHFCNLLSFVWARLAEGRDAARFLPRVQVATASCLLLVAAAPTGVLGLLMMLAGAVGARLFWSVVLTLRAPVWRRLYPRESRARLTGTFFALHSIVMAAAGLTVGSLVDWNGSAYPIVYAVAALLGVGGAAVFHGLRIPAADSDAQTVAARGRTGGARESWRILRQDPPFARYLFWLSMIHCGNLMLLGPLIVLMSDQLLLAQRQQVMVTSSIPLILFPLAVPLWARLFDRGCVLRFQAINGVAFAVAILALAAPAIAGRPEWLWAGAVLLGIAYAGGSVGWHLGTHRFAPRGRTLAYMGLHVSVSGLRGLLAPLAGISLYELIETRAPGQGAWVLVVPPALCALGAARFARLATQRAPSRGGAGAAVSSLRRRARAFAVGAAVAMVLLGSAARGGSATRPDASVGGQELHLLFMFTNVDHKPALQRKFAICIQSLFENLALPEATTLNIHFVADAESRGYGEQLLARYRRPDVRFVFHDRDEIAGRIFPIVAEMQQHFSAGEDAYYHDSIFFLSIGMHRVMPPEIDKIVQLDFDVMFETSVHRLFEEFDRFDDDDLIGLAPEMQPVYRHLLSAYRRNHPETRAGSPLPAGLPGFNSGAILLDLARLRESELYNRSLEPPAVAELVEKYSFQGHLGDQDFFTLLGFEHEELFYALDCGWNRQLCTWWRDTASYEGEIFDRFHACDSEPKITHGNCSTPIPGSEVYLRKMPGARARRPHSGAAETPALPAMRPGAGETPAIHLAVVACGDRLEETLVMLKSAVLFTRAPLRFHIFADDELRPLFQRRLGAWPADVRQRFETTLYPIGYPGVDAEAWVKLFKPCASQRLFIPDRIDDTDRLLYVDTDILFLRPLDDLWSTFDAFDRDDLAALAPEHEIARISWYRRSAQHPFVPPYGVNSGVMLMDLPRMRAAGWRERMVDYRARYPAIPWGDQDLINIFFHDAPDLLRGTSCEWNYRPDHCRYGSNCLPAEADGAAVLHGNRRAFHDPEYPLWNAVYDVFERYDFGQDLSRHLLAPLKAALATPEIAERPCGQVDEVFTEQLARRIEPRGDGAPSADELDFYREVAAAQLDPWRETGITAGALARARELPHGVVRYQISDGRLYRGRDCPFSKRCEGIEHFLLEVAPELPDLEIVVNVNDFPLTSSADPLPVLSFSKIPGRHADILYPAWAFWEGGPWLKVIPGWRWDLNRRQLLAAGDAVPWQAKDDIVFFRGSRTNADRDAFVLHSREHETWDVRFTLNQSQRATRYVTEVLKVEPAEHVSPADHCRYRYLLNFDGVAASFRLRNILACGATVLYANPTWVEFFYAQLEPWKHYVPLPLDVAEARRVVELLRTDEMLPRRIAYNGRQFVKRHLTLGHVRRYWLRLLQEYASLQRFEPRRDDGLVRVPVAQAAVAKAAASRH